MNPTSRTPTQQAAPAPHAHAALNGLDTASATHLQSAAQRLEQSRERLLRAMTPPLPPDDQRQQHTQQMLRNHEHELLQRRIAAQDGTPPPVVQHLLVKARRWWSSHPLHHVGSLALHSAETAARPMVRQHPVAWLSAAVVCGAALAWTRPWRFMNRRVVAAALVPGVLPGLLPGLLRTLTPLMAPLLLPLLLPRVGPSMWARVVHALGALFPHQQRPHERPAAPRANTTDGSRRAGLNS